MEIKALYKKFLKYKQVSVPKNKVQGRKPITVSGRGLWDKSKSKVIVPSNRITMKGPKGEQDFFKGPVLATGLQSGKQVMMQPGREYYFPEDKAVFEKQMQNGGLFAVGPYDEMMAPKQGNYLQPDINRPSYMDDEGGRRSEYRTGINIDGKETLIPTVVGGRQLSDDEALAQFERTGLHMGQYDTVEEADAASKMRTAKYNMLEDPVRFKKQDYVPNMQYGGTVQTSMFQPIKKEEDSLPVMLDSLFSQFQKTRQEFGVEPEEGKQMQDGAETSTEENPEQIEQVNVRAPQRSWFDRNIERPLRKFGRSYAQRINDATGGSEWYKQANPFMNLALEAVNAPQYAATYAVTGKVQNPSEAMNIQNPYGAFAVDAVLDPTNLVGAGLLKQPAKNLGKDIVGSLKNSKKPINNFTSEIDWAKWNPDTPKYPELINEYNAIEKSTKQSGTWMKNPDGSSFQGTPEQFIQQQSSYFKKAFPNILRTDAGNIEITYHGSPSKFNYFDGTIVNHGRTRGHGIYTTPSFKKASGYTKSEDGKVYEFYQNAAKKQDKYFKLKQESDKKLKEFLKNNPKDSPDYDKKFNDLVEEDNKAFDGLSIEEFKLREGFDFYPAELDEYVVPFTNYPKSAKNNVGFFDMTNPNIYKAVAPAGAGIGVGASQMNKQKSGMQMGGMSIPGVNGTVIASSPSLYKKYQKGGVNSNEESPTRPADLPPMTAQAGRLNQWLYDQATKKQLALQAQYDIEEATNKEQRYVNSPKYAELLTTEFYGPDKLFNELDDTQYQNISNNLQNRNENLNTLNLNLKDLSKKNIKAGYDPNLHTLYVPGSRTQRGVYSHELSHVGDQAPFAEGNNPGVGPYFQQELKRSMYSKESPEFLNQPSTLKKNKTVKENVEEDFNEAEYLTDPTEVKARLRALRDASVEQGYKLLAPDYNVDQYKKGFTEEETRQYQQLKKAGLSDEKINEMMYLFAKNNQKSETTAKLGGRLINAYTRTKSQ
jgi:hypothetical protein